MSWLGATMLRPGIPMEDIGIDMSACMELDIKLL